MEEDKLEAKEEECQAGGRRLMEQGNRGGQEGLRGWIHRPALAASLCRPSQEAEEMERRQPEMMGTKGNSWHD